MFLGIWVLGGGGGGSQGGWGTTCLSSFPAPAAQKLEMSETDFFAHHFLPKPRGSAARGRRCRKAWTGPVQRRRRKNMRTQQPTLSLGRTSLSPNRNEPDATLTLRTGARGLESVEEVDIVGGGMGRPACALLEYRFCCRNFSRVSFSKY